MHWQEIQGWFHWRSGQIEAVEHFGNGSVFVEVGLYLGRSLCSLAELVQCSGKDIRVFGVDHCRGNGPEGRQRKDYHRQAVERGGGSFAGELHRNVLACGAGDTASLLVSSSTNAAALFADRSLDWVHLDTRHDYASVCCDIKAWLPKIRAGGWLSGDDFDAERWPEVVEAVGDFLPTAAPWSSGQWRVQIN